MHKSISILGALMLLAGCVSETPPPSCKGDNLRPVNADMVKLSQTSSISTALSYRNCNQVSG